MQKCHPNLHLREILSLLPPPNPSKFLQKPDFGRMVCRLTHTGRNTKLQKLKKKNSHDTRKSKQQRTEKPFELCR